MRIGIYDPYLDTLGGGENYVLSIASCLSDRHHVTLFWDDKSILEKAQKRFTIDLTGVTVSPNIFTKSTIRKFLSMLRYDVIFFVSDGSIPSLFARKNVLILQYPVNWVDGKTKKNTVKLKRIKTVLCYSEFVKKSIDKTFGIDATVLPPCIAPIPADLRKKEKIILSVGRFTKAMNTKKQEILIDVFKKGYRDGLHGWKLVILGSVLEQDKDYVKTLKDSAKGYPITILHNVSYEMLKGYYKAASIYWHAAGYGENLTEHPERAEHFGITTVEAMSAGCVPVVINAGGQKEIVQDGVSGFLWNSEVELLTKTQSLIENKIQRHEMAEAAMRRAAFYNQEHFCRIVRQIIA